MPLGKPTWLFGICHIGGALGRGGQIAGRFGGIVTAVLVFPVNRGEGHGGKEAKDFLHRFIQA